MPRTAKVSIWIVLATVLAGCALQPMPPGGDLPGFFTGLLHGLIIFFSLIASIFWDVRIYAFPNSGGWYDFGFFIGVALWGGAFGTRRW
jgi:hypothetical protein